MKRSLIALLLLLIVLIALLLYYYYFIRNNCTPKCEESQKCVKGKCVDADTCTPKCMESQKCVNGKCVDADTCTPKCEESQKCVKGKCVDADTCTPKCEESQKCVNGKCVDADTCTPKCEESQKCVKGKCVDADTCTPKCEESQKCVNGKCVDADTCTPKCEESQKCVNGKCGLYYCVQDHDNLNVCKFYSDDKIKDNYVSIFGPFTDDKCGNSCSNSCDFCKVGTICLADNKECVKCDDIDLTTIDNLREDSTFFIAYKQGGEVPDFTGKNRITVTLKQNKDKLFFSLYDRHNEFIWDITKNKDKTFDVSMKDRDGNYITFKNFKRYDKYTFKSDPSADNNNLSMYLRLTACAYL